MNTESEKEKEKLTVKEFFSMGEVGKYFFRGKSDDKPANVNVKIMHGINRLAIIMFLAGVIYVVVKIYLR